jgi:hypothetical protein
MVKMETKKVAEAKINQERDRDETQEAAIKIKEAKYLVHDKFPSLSFGS